MAKRPIEQEPPAFTVEACLDSAGVTKTTVRYDRGETIFAQGDAGEHVLYVQAGGVKLSVRSTTGKEAVVAVLGPGDFFGEACLGGQRLRHGSATAITPTVVLRVAKRAMTRLLHSQQAMSDHFISHMLARSIRIEDDLVVQLLNSSEKRLARALLALARYGIQEAPLRLVPRLSAATLAQIVGTTPARVSFLLNKFGKLGFIHRNGKGPVTIDSSLLSVVLRD
jgi:CRP/FNR family transcriptional regulator, cyclic AMP receptor protein